MTADIFSDDADEDSADSDEEVDLDCGRGVGGVSSTSANAVSAERSGQKKVLKAMSVGIHGTAKYLVKYNGLILITGCL
ncbi:unnamed protein product [Rodentolepis nana]|uniref:Exosome complex component RRP42 n=1 Tax=Rodentolepis nana TaxID=102285 RepID=A0A0R3TDV6_RODNA|nr:unnamed protein product [Rodentolepis nana]